MAIQIDKQNVINPFYEKIINLHFYVKYDDILEAQSIITKNRGFKPSISISGSILPNSLFTHLEIRIVNGNINFDIYNFERVSIDAGYQDALMIKGLTGRITQAYVESPGPDGITVFIILLGQEEFMSKNFESGIVENPNTFSFKNGMTYGDILESFLSKCASPPNNLHLYTLNMDQQLRLKTYGTTDGTDVQVFGSVAFILQTLINDKFKLNYSMKNDSINVFSRSIGSSTKAIEISRFSSTPSIRVSGHINFQSPWIPSLMPGDYIFIDPKFMRLTFGGYATTVGSDVKAPNVYNILKIDFDFSTVENTNMMVVDALASTEQAFSVDGGVV